MRHAAENPEARWHSCLLQPLQICQPLVNQDIAFSRNHVAWGEVIERFGPQRRNIRQFPLLCRGIRLVISQKMLIIQIVSRCIQAFRFTPAPLYRIRYRISQYLHCRLSEPFVAEFEANCCGEISSGTIAGYNVTHFISAQLLRMRPRPA